MTTESPDKSEKKKRGKKYDPSLRGEVFITDGDMECQYCGDCPPEGYEMLKVFKNRSICKPCFKDRNASLNAPLPPPVEKHVNPAPMRPRLIKKD